MKKVFGVIGLFAIALVGSFSASAQATCEGYEASYAKFTENYAKPDVPSKKIAVAGGKEYLEKFSGCKDLQTITDYLKENVPVVEKEIEEIIYLDDVKPKIDGFVAALKAKNSDDLFKFGKLLLAIDRWKKENPDGELNISITLGSIAYDELAKSPANPKYNADSTNYAKAALKMLAAGRTSKTFGMGIYKYPSAAAATSWLNFTLAKIDVYDKKYESALSYLEATYKSPSDLQTKPQMYFELGGVYAQEVDKYYKASIAKVNEAKAKLDTRTGKPVEEQNAITLEANKITEEATTIYGNVRAYAERTIDAYARARMYLTDATGKPKDPKNKTFVDSLTAEITELYTLRFPKVASPKPAEVSAFAKTLTARTLPMPTSAVTPIVDAPATTTPATTAPTTPKATPAATTTPTSKPATTPAKPTTTPVKPAATTKPKTSSTATRKRTV